MPEEDFLDELPTTVPAAKDKDADMEQAVQAATTPGKKRIVKKLVRKIRPADAPAAPSLPSLPAVPAESAQCPEEEMLETETDEDELPVDESPVEEPREPDTLQTLPSPTASRAVPRPAVKTPASATLPVAVSDNPPTNVNQRWDEFLLTLEQATLIAVWELGIQSMTDFSTYSFEDLMKPRGRLTKPQATEVRDKLASFGVQLSQSSRAGSLRQGGGGQARIRGLRAPARNASNLPADASAQQRRQHRMMRNRLTM